MVIAYGPTQNWPTGAVEEQVMRLLQIAFKRETAAPMLALMFASGISIALVVARILWTGRLHYGFLIWNLLLAWFPLMFALLACDRFEKGKSARRGFALFALAWLLFFPNAPYIFTDLTHLWHGYRPHFWLDLMLILVCALTGLVLGFVSLYLMQTVVARRFGWMVSWLFVAMAAGLSSFGVYLGRFMRFNSWDPVLRPWRIFQGLDSLEGHLFHLTTFGFLVLFATFLFLAYVMLYALTHLSPAQPLATEKFRQA